MMEKILSSHVVVAEHFGDDPPSAPFPGEESLTVKAVPRRRSEVITTRNLARKCLQQLGVSACVIGKDAKGMPLWPTGCVGSLTHCSGYRAAVCAHSDCVRSCGIDAEPACALPRGVLASIADPHEQKMIAGLVTQRPDVCWDKILFSAKESIYKTWYPLTRRWLGFEDARCEIRIQDSDSGCIWGDFHAHILVPAHTCDQGADVRFFAGRWCVGGGYVLTGISLDRV